MTEYDIVIFGNYTKDTIISSAGTRYVDGGGFNYGAHAAAVSGLKVAAVTRLAREDHHVVDKLEQIGVDVFPVFTPSSTHMCLDYPTDNVDERILTCSVTAGTYTSDQFNGLSAKAFLINASVREEVPLNVIEALKKKGGYPKLYLSLFNLSIFVKIVDNSRQAKISHGHNNALIRVEGSSGLISKLFKFGSFGPHG